MTEPDVALTDYVLAIECLIFAAILHRNKARNVKLGRWFTLFFASICAASLFGGTVHGFFLEVDSLGHAILWPASLLTIGLTALAAWASGAEFLFSDRISRLIAAAAFAEFLAYAFVVLLITASFRIALLNYLPAALFLLLAFSVVYRREKNGSFLVAACGLVLTFAAALFQQFELGIHRVYFNHNAVYHIIQAGALFLIFLGGRRLVATEFKTRRESC